MCKEQMCPSGLAKSQELNGKAAFSVKSHSKVQALLLMRYTLCARLCEAVMWDRSATHVCFLVKWAAIFSSQWTAAIANQLLVTNCT